MHNWTQINSRHLVIFFGKLKKMLRDRELNPGLPRDRRRYLPLYYRGHVYNHVLFQLGGVCLQTSATTITICTSLLHLIYGTAVVWSNLHKTQLVGDTTNSQFAKLCNLLAIARQT